MKKTSTISDIAKIAGCAPTTVSRYLNKSGYVSEKTALQIQKAAKQLDYKPNFLARSLRNRINKTIFMAIPNIENPFFASFYKVMQKYATQNGYFLSVYDTGTTTQEEKRILSFAAELNVCGIIFYSDNFTNELLTEIEKLKIPTVVNYYDSCPFDSVHGKKNHSSYIATKHLFNYGHIKIGFAGGAKGTVIEESRKCGFLKAFEDSNIECDPMFIVETGFTLADGKKAGEYFLSLKNMPTAVCCVNDLVALGLITYLIGNGIHIPDDISVIGIDNIVYGEASFPPLTTVTSDAELFAESSFAMLHSRLSGEYTGKPRDAIIEHSLVIRSSTRKI